MWGHLKFIANDSSRTNYVHVSKLWRMKKLFVCFSLMRIRLFTIN